MTIQQTGRFYSENACAVLWKHSFRAPLLQGLPHSQHRYRLRSMVCYYGSHYSALVLLPALGGERWVLFDDARVSTVGSWADVLQKCEVGRIQPALLFFHRV